MIDLDIRWWGKDRGVKGESPTLAVSDFPDGQPHVKVLEGGWLDGPPGSEYPETRVVAAITYPSELLELALVANILNRKKVPWDLYITYLMGGRMDRPIDGNAPFTLRVVTDFLKTFGYRKVTLLDPHSDVSVALLDAEVVDNQKLVAIAVGLLTHGDAKGVTLIAPDVGASKKVAKIAEGLKLPMIQCLKERDMATGHLSNFRVAGHLPEGHVGLIVDDLIDGGRTFTGVAEALGGRVQLAVTHGVFSQGPKIKGIEHIYTTDSYQDMESNGYRTVVPALSL